MYNAIRYTNELDADESEMINRWTADREEHIPRREILRIVDFYTAIAGTDFEGICTDIKNKISHMTDDEWDDCANRIPFEVPYAAVDMYGCDEYHWEEGIA